MSTQRTPIKSNPADSMVSTWRHDPSQRNFWHLIIELFGLHLVALNVEVPVFSNKDKIPAVREWTLHLWILLHAAIPLVLHHVYTTYTDQNLNLIAAFVLYSSAYKLHAIHGMHVLRRLGKIYGFLDGHNHPRDDIPDIGVGKVIQELVSVTTLRMIMAIFLAYRPSETPASLEWRWLPLEIGTYVSRSTSGFTGITV